LQIRDAAVRADAGEWLGPRAHPCGLGVRNARNAPRPNPEACPVPRRTPVQAQPHRLRSKRDATRRPGAAGRCGAAVLGQRVRERPVPKGVQEVNQLHKCPGLRRNPWRWYEPAGPTGDRHDAHMASMEHVYHRDGASGSHTGARTARRTTGDRKLRAEARCWYLFRGIKNGCLRLPWSQRSRSEAEHAQRRSAATQSHQAPPERASSIET